MFINPGSPWENGHIESLNGRLRDELPKQETFYTLQEAQVPIERWRYEARLQAPAQLAGEQAARTRGLPGAELRISTQRHSGFRANIDTGADSGGGSHKKPRVAEDAARAFARQGRRVIRCPRSYERGGSKLLGAPWCVWVEVTLEGEGK